MKLPASFKKYFWDVNFSELNLEKNREYIAERILEYGDVKAVRWMLKHIPRIVVRRVLQRSRGFSPRTINFWSLVFDIDRNKILCFQKSYQKMQKAHWQY